MNSTTATTAALTDQERAAVELLAAHRVGTVLIDNRESAWQIGNARRVDAATLAFLGYFRTITAVGDKSVYALKLDDGPETDERLRGVLAAGPFTPVWAPLPELETPSEYDLDVLAGYAPAASPVTEADLAENLALAQRIAAGRRYVSRTWHGRTATIAYVTPETVCFDLSEDGRSEPGRVLTPRQFEAEFTAGDPGDARFPSSLITEAETPESRYHLETDLGERWTASRRAAVRYAKTFETAEVWDTCAEDPSGLERIYCAA